MSTNEPCETLISLLRIKSLRLLDYLTILVGEDEAKKEMLDDIRALVSTMSEVTLITYLRFKFPSNPDGIEARVATLCGEYGLLPNPTEMTKLLRFASFYQAALWGGPTA